MPVRKDQNRDWIRKLDGDLHVPSEQPFQRTYPIDVAQVVESVIMAGSTKDAPRQARACGSHWGISECAVTNGTMIETSTPVHEGNGDQSAARLNHALRDIIPDCLTGEAWEFFEHQTVPTFNPMVMPSHAEVYLFHVEAGMRIHELYWLMDSDTEMTDKRSLAARLKEKGASGDYAGPWACETLGGAGGQTIVGAMSTGTHGGDVKFGPIASMAVALHLVDAEGKHHWIERTGLRPTMPLRLVDEGLIKERFKMEYHRDDDLFNAVVVSCGRMGVIYSVVLRAVRQYGLEEAVGEMDWGVVRTFINNKGAYFLNRFVSVEINPNGQWKHPSQHTCFLRTRRLCPLDWAGSPPFGRNERGVKHGTEVNLTGGAGGFSATMCGSDDALRAALGFVGDYFEKAREKALVVWLVCEAIILTPLPLPPGIREAAWVAQNSATGVIAFTTLMLDVVGRVGNHILPTPPDTYTFGDIIALALNFLADLSHIAQTISLHHADIFFIIRMIIGQVFRDEAGVQLKGPAISYGALDGHNYQNKGCVAPGDSIEIFFDANDPNIIVFIEKCFQRIHQLEEGEITSNGRPAIFGGYISARFMAGSDAFLAMQRWPVTCALEIAGLSRVNGTPKFLEMVESDAVAMNAVIHWGQRNHWQMKEVELVYDPKPPAGALFRWRKALSLLSDHGRLDLFSTKFSRRRGLEITTPRIKSLFCVPDLLCAEGLTVVEWSAKSNPPETVAELRITRSDGSSSVQALPSLEGSLPLTAGPRISTFELVLTRELNGQIYEDSRSIQCEGIVNGDERVFQFTAELFRENGQDFWAYFQTLKSRFISNALRVSEIEVAYTGTQTWTLTTPGFPVFKINKSPTRIFLPTTPIFNGEWNYRANLPHVPGLPPQLTIRYKLLC